uniref:Uncharacterized protein n=1 Tax=Plectus sambesii TaxID=2011161 RepID=A0A914WPL8_9BILA
MEAICEGAEGREGSRKNYASVGGVVDYGHAAFHGKPALRGVRNRREAPFKRFVSPPPDDRQLQTDGIEADFGSVDAVTSRPPENLNIATLASHST